MDINSITINNLGTCSGYISTLSHTWIVGLVNVEHSEKMLVMILRERLGE
jgi:hypothetical protein